MVFRGCPASQEPNSYHVVRRGASMDQMGVQVLKVRGFSNCFLDLSGLYDGRLLVT